MARRIILGLIFAGVVALSYVGYNNWKQKRAMLSGEVMGGSSDPDLVSTPSATAATRSPSRSEQAASPSALPSAPPSDTSNGTRASALSPTVSVAADTIAPQPPGGTVYAGTGHFQVYRQGNLTWRINTDTGRTCVLFATDEEWRKPRVYQQGCGNTAQ